jgi:hypothetical protein
LQSLIVDYIKGDAMSISLSVYLQALSGSGLVFFASVIVMGRRPHRGSRCRPGFGLRLKRALRSRLRKLLIGRAD